jgi:hypothetical protein
MKNALIITVLFLGINFIGCSQKNVPENVKKVFAEKFSTAKSVKWDSEMENEWEAEFKMNGKEMTATFDGSGKWLETEASVSMKDLPVAVANTIKNEFKDFKTGEVSTVENAEIKGFEIALKNKETKLSVIIDSEGKVLKKETVKEENEKEEKEKK